MKLSLSPAPHKANDSVKLFTLQLPSLVHVAGWEPGVVLDPQRSVSGFVAVC